jgi:hypothetical protein
LTRKRIKNGVKDRQSTPHILILVFEFNEFVQDTGKIQVRHGALPISSGANALSGSLGAHGEF